MSILYYEGQPMNNEYFWAKHYNMENNGNSSQQNNTNI